MAGIAILRREGGITLFARVRTRTHDMVQSRVHCTTQVPYSRVAEWPSGRVISIWSGTWTRDRMGALSYITVEYSRAQCSRGILVCTYQGRQWQWRCSWESLKSRDCSPFQMLWRIQYHNIVFYDVIAGLDGENIGPCTPQSHPPVYYGKVSGRTRQWSGPVRFKLRVQGRQDRRRVRVAVFVLFATLMPGDGMVCWDGGLDLDSWDEITCGEVMNYM